MKTSKQKNKRDDFNKRIIQKKTSEIESLKEKISELEIICKEKDELINSVACFRDELKNVIEDLNAKKNEYDSLIKDLRQMKKVFNTEVFHGRWWLIRLLMK